MVDLRYWLNSSLILNEEKKMARSELVLSRERLIKKIEEHLDLVERKDRMKEKARLLGMSPVSKRLRFKTEEKRKQFLRDIIEAFLKVDKSFFKKSSKITVSRVFDFLTISHGDGSSWEEEYKNVINKI